jgi:hypothetical protein
MTAQQSSYAFDKKVRWYESQGFSRELALEFTREDLYRQK